jgi:hypothetical protein
VNGTFVDNLTKLIMDALLQYGGLLELNLGLKLMCFGANGVTIFQGFKLDVIMQLK